MEKNAPDSLSCKKLARDCCTYPYLFQCSYSVFKSKALINTFMNTSKQIILHVVVMPREQLLHKRPNEVGLRNGTFLVYTHCFHPFAYIVEVMYTHFSIFNAFSTAFFIVWEHWPILPNRLHRLQIGGTCEHTMDMCSILCCNNMTV